jgi:hypothetical protein
MNNDNINNNSKKITSKNNIIKKLLAIKQKEKREKDLTESIYALK